MKETTTLLPGIGVHKTILIRHDIEVSIITYGYGSEKAPYEVAIVKDGKVWDNNPIVESFRGGALGDGTVVGWLTNDDVDDFIFHTIEMVRGGWV